MGGAEPASAEVDRLPGWVSLLRAPNPGPMTLDGTNTWILRAPGAEFATVIDPGPLDEGHLRAIAEQGPYRSILITHGHHDHVEGAGRLAELLGGVPVRAAGREHGEPFDSGVTPDRDGLAIHVLETPGHTGDSVCFLVECGSERVMFTGDTILGRGTTVVAAPDGDLGSYLSSLRLLRAYEKVLMLPGHGPARADTAALAEEYLSHRMERLAQVSAAMAAGARTPAAVVDLVYPDIDPRVRFAAEWSAAAQIDHLERESAAGADGLDRL
ncbi:glyoxylase-like metal-dependent hydrolase (beta-lactamase superfamily II) [Actinoplanes octamycinicus]|uniref:Glyoxylase-like metal-dependent hydrolase (Beta-lactamase superfamily II) n=1 Tax=Actinoplanes octamycinicus TaxID=135948 RepID=A0A7W7GT91_9ACTN|nr:MBL fold metallo-hydrolase [Actinoplanes octamycinicus]MBB4737843.1 glyoxylase-like metal-dependent hydrolase (beta-lactamase superfamily II) [Actinoplanes octamycinicus]